MNRTWRTTFAELLRRQIGHLEALGVVDPSRAIALRAYFMTIGFSERRGDVVVGLLSAAAAILEEPDHNGTN